MTITAKYRYAAALLLRTENILAMHSLITECYPSAAYSAKLKNGASIRFDSVDELISYDNFDAQRIIKVNAYDSLRSFSLTIAPTSGIFTAYQSTIEASIETSNPEATSILTTKLDNVFKKARQSRRYCFMSKLTVQMILLIVSVCLYVATSIVSGSFTFTPPPIPFYIVTFVIVYLIIWGASRLWKSLFPPVVFSWGREAERILELASRRNNILWCIIIAPVLTIVLTFLTNRVFGW